MAWIKPLKQDPKAVRRKQALEKSAQEHIPLNFATEPERRQWIIDHADYFTTYLRSGRKVLRSDHTTLANATKAAHRIARQQKRPIMVYAVAGIHDTWVCNVKPE